MRSVAQRLMLAVSDRYTIYLCIWRSWWHVEKAVQSTNLSAPTTAENSTVIGCQTTILTTVDTQSRRSMVDSDTWNPLSHVIPCNEASNRRDTPHHLAIAHAPSSTELAHYVRGSDKEPCSANAAITAGYTTLWILLTTKTCCCIKARPLSAARPRLHLNPLFYVLGERHWLSISSL
jgi:hypothetical protein